MYAGHAIPSAGVIELGDEGELMPGLRAVRTIISLLLKLPNHNKLTDQNQFTKQTAASSAEQRRGSPTRDRSSIHIICTPANAFTSSTSAHSSRQ